ncbi:MAG: FtsW/RodA/SpoVE family cell cycle protein, partial [Oscillospiraceae bacterium]|nr:FtsW/RodA/SpoVE family cell cycle protein [Oscillospiraceae bacterium]
MARKARRDLTIEQKLARGPIDLPFLALVMLLTGIGLIMLLSASFASAMYNLDKAVNTKGDPMYYFNRQFVFAAFGIAAMFIISKINYQHFRWMSVFGLAGAVILMLLVVLTPLGSNGGGARRWLKLGPIRFQPSEIAKVGIIMFFAARLSTRNTPLGPPKKWNRRTLLGRTCERLDRIGFLELIPYGVALLVVLGVIAMQKHMSAMILVIVAAASVLFASGIRLYWFIGAGAAIVPALWFIITQTNYMTKRIEIWQNPLSDLENGGYQPWQGRIAIGSGGLLGVGLGNSRQKYLFLPEEHNDYIFPIVCEELGMVGA